MTEEKKYDVVIYEIATRQIDAVVGKNLSKDSGFHNAQKRLQTVFERGNLNGNFSARIVEAGKYKEGDVLA